MGVSGVGSVETVSVNFAQGWKVIEPSGIDTKIFTDEDCADFILSNPR